MAEFIPHDDPRRKVVVPDETKSGGDNTPQVYQKTNTDFILQVKHMFYCLY